MNALVAGAREVVLVVDDSPATLGMLNEALEAAGYTVLVAQAGSAALALMERITPDIVLMDAVMPGLDGFETCRRMKGSAGLAAVPVVFMTGLTETEHVLRGLEAGGVDYVPKPVSPDEVVARVGVHLATARLTRSAHIALDTAGRFLLAASRDGRVLWCTPQAARLMEAGQGVPPRWPGCWPAPTRPGAGRTPPSPSALRRAARCCGCRMSARSGRTSCCCAWRRGAATRRRCGTCSA